MHKVIVIVGATASGKTSLAITIAQRVAGEVISADSRQVYTGLDIGSGKVTPEEMDGVPHHLLDVADPQDTYTAGDFARDGRSALEDILKRNHVPIIAGGSGFYIDALLDPTLLANVPPNEALRAELADKSAEELFTILKEHDPARAHDLQTKGEDALVRRLIRAIEVAHSPTLEHTDTASDIAVLWIGIAWDTDVLRERIHTRLIERLDAGMIEEAQRLHANGLTYERMEELGLEYRFLARYLKKELSYDALVSQLSIAIGQYAKRQRTWFKRNENIHWFDGNDLTEVPSLVEGFLT